MFLDRDGTLMEEVHYCAAPALVRVFPGTANAIRRLKESGYLVVIITNQSGIGRGLLTEAQYHAVQAELMRQLEEEGKMGRMGLIGQMGRMEDSELSPSSPIAASYFCPDAPPTPSPRRKPEPGMVLAAARDLNLDLARSWFVGDKAADIGCGKRAGTRTILVQTGYGASEAKTADSMGVSPDFVAKDVVAAVEIILHN